MSGLAVGGKLEGGGAQSFKELAQMEIDVMQQQAMWLHAFASALVDAAPAGSVALLEQAAFISKEWEAARRRFIALAIQEGGK